MNTKVNEGKLIGGKEALIALANGEDVECRAYEHNWINVDNKHHPLSLFFDDSFQFRLKPHTITINGIKVPAPFEPKEGDKTYYLTDGMTEGYRDGEHLEHFEYHFGAWRTEEEIKQVVAALRQIFGASHD